MAGLRYIFLTTSNHILTCSPVCRKVKIPDDLPLLTSITVGHLKFRQEEHSAVFNSYRALKGV